MMTRPVASLESFFHFYTMKKRIVITGANSGIGLATAKSLAAQNELALLCRTRQKGEEAKAAVLRVSPGAQVNVMPLDLHDFDSVNQAAKQLVAQWDSIDVLVNNAGYFPEQIAYIGEVEKTLYASHLGHLLLTLRLLPLLEKSAEARVINVSSGLHVRGNVRHFFRRVPGLTPFQAYADAKLANILFTLALKDKVPAQISPFALHPGVVATSFDRSIAGWFKLMIRAVKPLFFISPEAGAATSVYLATAPFPAVEPYRGGYFAKSRPARIQNAGATRAQAEELWRKSLAVLQPHL